MYRKLTILAASAALSMLPSAHAQQAAAQPASAPAQAVDPAHLFGAREGVEYIDISPDGRHVVYLQPESDRATAVLVHELGSSSAPRVVVRSSGRPERLRWCNFVTNERLICQLSGMTRPHDLLIPFSRLVSMDTSGDNVTLLGESSSFFDARLRQFDGEIIDWLPGENGAVLMARDHVPEAGRIGSRLARTADGLGVDRIDARTVRSSRVEAPNPDAAGYISDGRGNVRIMVVQRVRGATGMLASDVDYFYRTPDSRDWRPFSSSGGTSGDGMTPIAVDSTRNAAYVLKRLDGRLALYRVSLDGSLTTELVHSNPQVDVDDVVRVSRGGRVIGVTFADEQRRVVYFDPDYAAIARSLARAIPQLPLIDFVSASADGNRLLIHAGSDVDAGRYYVYDRGSRTLAEILMTRPQLENVATARVQAVTYPAADGTRIPAYLTLPPGENRRNLPVVILPHGGPAARDEWGFDWIVQYLANRGYAVLQPNYRGSAGYGDEWLRENGFRSWRTSIGDIIDGARWIAAEGIGDADRIAIVGWSYGGYAALQSGIVDPRLFRAVVGIAPVTDLQQIKDDTSHYTAGRNVAEYVGSGPHIQQGSPLRNVQAIAAPVLLFHGDRDLNVSHAHSERMDRALRSAGKRSELVVFEGLEHDLADSAARAQMLQRIGTFLGTELASARRE